MIGEMGSVHPAWLPGTATAGVGVKRVCVLGDDPSLQTLREEVASAVWLHGGALAETAAAADLVFALDAHAPVDGFDLAADEAAFVVHSASARGLIDGYFHLLRTPATAWQGGRYEPKLGLRMLDHWDNMTAHPVMGEVERGYAGGSIFFAYGQVREDLGRVEAYARLLASVGINRVSINNVNVHQREALFITELLPGVARIASIFRRWGIRVHLSVNFFAPMSVGGLETADPADARVQQWWAEVVAGIYEVIPDFGGFVVKADSEGQPGPIKYGRTHAEGANLLARALKPHGGLLHWRAFVYNHEQDWRDRTTDRARAAYDHFTPLDGAFDDNVILQVKHGPLDFQVREAISPLFGATQRTNIALELQVTQEYTGQQKHVCYLGPWWEEILQFPVAADDAPLSQAIPGGIVAVSNVGNDEFWTGHPLAQANLYAYGRLAWDPALDANEVLHEWARLTFSDDPECVQGVVAVMRDSWQTYEKYTAPLGVCFMVQPGHHYGPSVDGYEYSKWGTYHFADRDGIGVDRTVATGTGFTSQYRSPWRERYEDLACCPDELLLFFHHVPYSHVLHSGKTVIQHIYDTHFEGVDEVERQRIRWEALAEGVGRTASSRFHARVSSLLEEQQRCSIEWRDQVNTYFWRKSGIPDAEGRTIY